LESAAAAAEAERLEAQRVEALEETQQLREQQRDLAQGQATLKDLTQELAANQTRAQEAVQEAEQRAARATLARQEAEHGRAEADRGAGVITDPAVHERVLGELAEHVRAEFGDAWRGVTESPLLGPAGNKEFLVLLEKAR